MSLNQADHIEDLDATQPPAGDPASQADDHIRAIKKAITQTFPNGFESPLNVTDELLNGFESRIAALEALPAPTYAGPKIGSLTVTGTGTTAVTGVGYQPSVVIFWATSRNGAAASETNLSVGISNAGVIAATQVASGSNPGSAAADSTQDAYVILSGQSSSSSTLARGSVSSLDSDGFTLNETVGSVNVDVIWMAFP